MIEYKTCGTCKKEYPKTKKYFFIKKIKQKLATGKIAIYNSFRSDCKKCFGSKGEKRRIKQRCKELDCNILDYRKNWKKQQSETRIIDAEAREFLTKGKYSYYLILLKKGAVTDLKSFLLYTENSKLERNKRIVKEVLSKQKYFTKEDKRLALRMYARNNKDRLTDCYIANHVFKCKIADLSPSIIETKRNIIKLKRELITLK